MAVIRLVSSSTVVVCFCGRLHEAYVTIFYPVHVNPRKSSGTFIRILKPPPIANKLEPREILCVMLKQAPINKHVRGLADLS